MPIADSLIVKFYFARLLHRYEEQIHGLNPI